MYHLWFDPGDMTGWAEFENDKVLRMGELAYGPQLFDWLINYSLPAYLGIENYRLNPRGARYGHTPTGSTVTAVRAIGAIELAGRIHGVRNIVFQEKDIKPVGYGMAGLTYVKGKKGTHMQDAIAHGTYWWMQKGRHLGR